MIKTFTKDDLLLYAYGETNEEETVDIQNALICDENLQEEFLMISQTINSLDGCMQNPSEKSMSRILDFSKSFKLRSDVK